MICLQCRECGADLPTDAGQCPQCSCRAPFACSVCARRLSAVSLGIAQTIKNPHGAFSREGEPLCHEHRLTRCHECERLFPLGDLTRSKVGIHEDRELREGKPPRLEPIFGYHCAACSATRAGLTADGDAPSGPVARLYAWSIGVLILIGATVLSVLALQPVR